MLGLVEKFDTKGKVKHNRFLMTVSEIHIYGGIFILGQLFSVA